MSRPKVLVLGGSGQLGQAIARDPSASKYEVHAPPTAQVDVRDSATLLASIDAIRPDYVINCAAYTAVDRAESERDLAFLVNADGARHVAEACNRSGAYLIHISTDYVFDGASDRAYRESDAAMPLNVYGESKLLGEHYVAAAAPGSCVLRVSWLFGSSSSSFVAKILARAQRGEPLRVVDDEFGCPTAAAGVAGVLLQILGRGARPAGLFHYCGTPQTTRHGFATEIVRQAHEIGVLPSAVDVTPITSDALGGTTRRPKYSVLDTAKIAAELGIERDSWIDRLPQVLSRR